MNCKQGDLAVIVRSASGNEGRILTCLRVAPRSKVRSEGFTDGDWTGVVWETDAFLADTWGEGTSLYPDARLRPLRNSEGEDEMLKLVGLPAGTPQAA